jgi:hypothetical protein
MSVFSKTISTIRSNSIRSPGNKQLGGVMDIFKSIMPSGPGAQPNPNVPNIPTGNPNPGMPLQGTQASQVTAPNGTIPSQDPNANPGNPGTAQSPLDAFKDVWETPVNSDPNANAPMFANLDPQKLMESAKKVNFAQVLTPETMAKITAGGTDAAQAFAESMNLVAQQVYAQSALATTKIVEQALTKSNERRDAELPNLVKKFSANESLLTENPILSNPALKPLVGALQEQFVRKNPNATSAELQTQVLGYLNAVGANFSPASTAAAKAATQQSAQSEDWEKFFS